jgi:endonuclease YncB( thermonuclease family)
MVKSINIFTILFLIHLISFKIVSCINYNKSSKKKSKPNIIIGEAVVIDGNNILINKEKIKLLGVNAPGIDQVCSNENVGYNAKSYLELLLDKNYVECRSRGFDKDETSKRLSICYIKHLDKEGNVIDESFKEIYKYEINKIMIKSGYAFNDTRNGNLYKEEEKYAKENNLPVWKFRCDDPYRYQNKKIDL